MFLFTNQTDVTQRVSLNLGRYSTGIASIGPKSWVKRGVDEEWSTGSDAFGSATNSDSDEFETMATEGMEVESGTTSNADGTSSTRSGVVATSSNIERQTLKGQWLEMVLADRRAGRGFVTTAEDLELEQLKDLASDSDADFYESETEIAVVRAWAEQGSLPDHASLEVTQISGDEGQDGEEYQEYQRAKEALDQQEIAYDGMMAFDIGFLDEQGEEIEPELWRYILNSRTGHFRRMQIPSRLRFSICLKTARR